MASREPNSGNTHDPGDAPQGPAELRPDYNAADDRDDDLEDFDWNDLEARFMAAMAKCSEEEQLLAEEAAVLFEIFSAWMSVTPRHEDTRAMKRFKTRIAYVQDSEETLALKKKHYNQVVLAFENALALLRND